MSDVKLYNGDCLEVMKQIPDEKINLTVTSPPYDNLRTYNGNISQWSFEKFQDIAKELYRITKDGGVVVWVVNDATIEGSETGTSFKQALYFKEIGFNLHDTMIFRKKNPIPQIYRKRYQNEFEYMFVFSKGKCKTHNPIMVDCIHHGLQLNGTTYKNYSRAEQKRDKQASPVKEKKIKGNIWEYVVGKNKEDVKAAKNHPATFPLQLANDHIISWSNEGDTVLDCFMGSGTTGVAAQNLNRDFIGIELDENYFEIAKSRIENTKNDLLDLNIKLNNSTKNDSKNKLF